ncbi:MAG: flagellar biosynthesis repressor FlbT [Pseudomonadota bacterium]
MSGLVLKLSPKERVLVNGAIIENGDRRSRLSIMTPGANILRLKDAIHPEDAKTPLRRVCYAVQMVLSGDSDPVEVDLTLRRQIEDLAPMFGDPDSQQTLTEAQSYLSDGHHYKCLRSLRHLFPVEDAMVSQSRA